MLSGWERRAIYKRELRITMILSNQCRVRVGGHEIGHCGVNWWDEDSVDHMQSKRKKASKRYWKANKFWHLINEAKRTGCHNNNDRVTAAHEGAHCIAAWLLTIVRFQMVEKSRLKAESCEFKATLIPNKGEYDGCTFTIGPSATKEAS
ncbi:hypothetical protein niasHT_029823 [Heterodera trifolii]|uniref:Uncharacterized protein n=1 Tax=Heterodera trifolii TaxID=157864 RepID=A0ABD2K0P7_9BILA